MNLQRRSSSGSRRLLLLLLLEQRLDLSRACRRDATRNKVRRAAARQAPLMLLLLALQTLHLCTEISDVIAHSICVLRSHGVRGCSSSAGCCSSRRRVNRAHGRGCRRCRCRDLVELECMWLLRRQASSCSCSSNVGQQPKRCVAGRHGARGVDHHGRRGGAGCRGRRDVVLVADGAGRPTCDARCAACGVGELRCGVGGVERGGNGAGGARAVAHRGRGGVGAAGCAETACKGVRRHSLCRGTTFFCFLFLLSVFAGGLFVFTESCVHCGYSFEVDSVANAQRKRSSERATGTINFLGKTFFSKTTKVLGTNQFAISSPPGTFRPTTFSQTECLLLLILLFRLLLPFRRVQCCSFDSKRIFSSTLFPTPSRFVLSFV